MKNAFNDPNDVYFGDQKEKFMVRHIQKVEPFPLMNTWSPVQTVANISKRSYIRHNTNSKPKSANTSKTSRNRRKTGGERKTGSKRKTSSKRKSRKTK